MPRPRTPLAKARLTGADRKDPGRYRSRAEPPASGRPLGPPSGYLPAAAMEAWGTFADELPWLTHEDRAAVEVASLMRARVMAGRTDDLPAAFWAAYRSTLAALGATPTDRSRVHQPPTEDDDDPFAAFDAGPH